MSLMPGNKIDGPYVRKKSGIFAHLDERHKVFKTRFSHHGYIFVARVL